MSLAEGNSFKSAIDTDSCLETHRQQLLDGITVQDIANQSNQKSRSKDSYIKGSDLGQEQSEATCTNEDDDGARNQKERLEPNALLDSLETHINSCDVENGAESNTHLDDSNDRTKDDFDNQSFIHKDRTVIDGPTDVEDNTMLDESNSQLDSLEQESNREICKESNENQIVANSNIALDQEPSVEDVEQISALSIHKPSIVHKPSIDPWCDLCYEDTDQKIQVGGFCSECNSFLCKPCLKAHKKSPASRTHKLLLGTRMPKSQADKPTKYPDCYTHVGNVKSKFCLHHGELTCSECARDNHHQCTVKSIQAVSKSVGETDVSQFIDRINNILKTFTDSKSLLENNVSGVESQRKEMLKSVSNLRETLNSKTAELCSSMATHIDSVYREKSSDVSDRILSLSELIDSYKDIISNMAKYKEFDPNHFLRIQDIVENARQHKAEFEDIIEEMKTITFTFSPNPDILTYISDCKALGDIDEAVSQLMKPHIPEIAFPETIETEDTQSAKLVKLQSGESKECSPEPEAAKKYVVCLANDTQSDIEKGHPQPEATKQNALCLTNDTQSDKEEEDHPQPEATKTNGSCFANDKQADKEREGHPQSDAAKKNALCLANDTQSDKDKECGPQPEATKNNALCSDKEQEPSSETACSLKQSSLNTTLDEDERPCQLSGMDVASDGTIFIVDYINKAVKVFSAANELMCVLSMFEVLSDIAIINNTTAVLSSHYELYILDISDLTSISVQRSIPLGFWIKSMTLCNDFLIVLKLGEPRCVKMMDLEGHELWSTSTDRYGQFLFEKAYALTATMINKRTTILVTDWKKNTIAMLDASTGDHIRTVDVKGKSPHGIIADGEGNVYTSYHRTKEVCLWSTDFQEFRTILTSKDLNGSPIFVMYNDSLNELCVSYNTKDKVDRFSLEIVHESYQWKTL